MKIYRVSEKQYLTKNGNPLFFDVDFKQFENRGYAVYIVRSYLDRNHSEEVGYMKVAWIPQDKWEQIYGNNYWKFRKLAKGHHDIPDKIIDLPNEKLRKFEIKKYIEKNYPYKDFGYFYNSEYGKAKNEYEEYKKHWVDKAHVDYISVPNEYRNQHIGINLYLFTSGWLKRNFGINLYRSDLLSDNAHRFHESDTTKEKLKFKVEKGDPSKDGYNRKGYNKDRYYIEGEEYENI